MTWQGRNALDDDGDGLPNLLDLGVGAKLFRVFAGDGLPADFATREAPLLAWLDRNGHRYDITTDVALAANRGPRLEDHRGVILPADARWLPRAPAQRLRAFVRGGRHASPPSASTRLRRQVSLTAAGGWSTRRRAATTDLFGARLIALVRLPKPTNLVSASDDIDLFGGTPARLRPVLARPGDRAHRGARPTGQRGHRGPADRRDRHRRPALRQGPRHPLRLPRASPSHLGARADDPNTIALMDRTWTLLSR